MFNVTAPEFLKMTYSAPSCDFYDDGLVHSHQWARNTPPGGKHNEHNHTAHDTDESKAHDHRGHK